MDFESKCNRSYGGAIDIISSINSYSGGDIPSFNSPYKNLPIGEYIINFSATDSRYDAGDSNSPSKQALTKEYNASLIVKATPPKLEIYSSNW